MTNDDDRRAADKAFDIAFRGETEGIDDAMAALFTAHRIAAERRGIERAAQVADEHACQHCAHIPAAIRSLTEGAWYERPRPPPALLARPQAAGPVLLRAERRHHRIKNNCN